MLFAILLTIHVLVCLTLGGLVLIQRSEGGALGMGGGPSGFMSARGAGNLLTRMTAICGVLFFALSISLTIVGNFEHRGRSAVDQVDTSKLTLPSALPQAPAQSAPAPSSAAPSLNDLPLANAPLPTAAQPVVPAAQASRPAVLPAPVKLPATSGVSSSAAKDVSKAKANIWDAPASGAAATSPAAKPASSAPASQ